ncbi:MAG: hypothetical protein IPN53_17385 [Comamonadaceae bacterium]|nr:hypothetical protein [Comamonadaceae bacterium]
MSHFDNPEAWNQSGFSTESAEGLSGDIPCRCPTPTCQYDIMIPGASEYYWCSTASVASAVSGELKPTRRSIWPPPTGKITDRLGLDQQTAFYRAS